jgi:integrase
MLLTKEYPSGTPDWIRPGAESLNEIKHLIKRGDMVGRVVWANGDDSVQFDSDVWPVGDDRLSFDRDERRYDENLPREMINQIKHATLFLALFATKQYKLGTLRGYLSSIKSFAYAAKKIGHDSLDGLNEEDMHRIFREGGCTTSESSLAGINSMLRIRDYLPFSLLEDVDRINSSLLKIEQKEPDQFPVIPYRVYCYTLDHCTAFLAAVHKDIDELRDAVTELVESHQIARDRIVVGLRNGDLSIDNVFGKRKGSYFNRAEKFLSEVKEAGLDLVDGKGKHRRYRPIHKDIGARIKRLREEKGLPTTTVSAMVGAGTTTCFNIENNNESTSRYLKSIVEALGEDFEEFAREPLECESGEPYDEWERLWHEHRPSVSTAQNEVEQGYEFTAEARSAKRVSITPRTIAGRDIKTPSDLQKLVHEVNHVSLFTIAQLTGMRAHELALIDPVYGAQHVVAGRDRRCIPIITTLTTKITESGQAKNRVFVTTKDSHLAFNLLNAIHGPYRKYLPAHQKNTMFVTLESVNSPRTPKKLPAYISQRIGKIHKFLDKSKCVLTDEDLKMLSQSEDGRIDRFKVGEQWDFSAHQLRRSLAYYLVGLELASFLELKAQFGHLSMEMTMYYGRNAEDFTEMYTALEIDRLEMQASKMSEIYSRIRNGDRIAGGKGKMLRREIQNDGFEEAVFDRKCSIEFWREELRLKQGAMRVHAVAPGIICTNAACDMHIEVDMSECIDCEFDFIESAVYAELARQAAMEKLAWMEDNNQEFPDMVVKQLVTIRSAEKIMSDLGIKCDAYAPAASHQNYLIPTVSA